MNRIYLSPPHMSCRERELLLDAFDSNWIAPLGPHVRAFEEELATRMGSGAHVAALSSGTAALHLALVLLGVGTGDEVIVSSLTFVASVNPIRYLGATPILIDAEPSTWNLDPDLVAEELDAAARRGKLPKAVIAVDLYGQTASYERLRPICARYGVPIVEDAAESLGSTHRGEPAGSLGDVGILSFNGNKILTTSGGGALVSRDENLVARARHLSTQAREPTPHYEHTELGYNYRLSNLLAAVGRGQLEALDERIAARRRVHRGYREGLADLPGVSFMPTSDACSWNHWLTCILLDPRRAAARPETVRAHLESLAIESRPLWKPMHRQPLYRDCRVRGGAVADALFSDGLCLPSGSSLRSSDLDRVVRGVREALGAAR